MKKTLTTFLFLGLTLLTVNAQKKIPLVYDQENTGAKFSAPVMPPASELPVINTLTDPLQWSNGRGRALKFKQWERRRNEIAAEIQHYEIGTKPSIKDATVKARMDGDTLIVDVTRNGKSLTLKSTIHYPTTGKAPYAVLIGSSGISLPRQLFSDLPISRPDRKRSLQRMGLGLQPID